MVTRSRSVSPTEAWNSVRSSVVAGWDELHERVADQPDGPAAALWLVRHGETTTNAEGLITGTRDAPLTDRGRRQARAAGAALAGRGFDLAFASQLRRSRETLELMVAAGRLTVAASAADARLAERSLGRLELTALSVDPRRPRGLRATPGGGESYLSLTRRCVSFLLDVRNLAAQLDRPLALLVSSHQGPMRILTGIIEEVGDPLDVLGRRFDNSRPECLELGRLSFPAFVGHPSGLTSSPMASSSGPGR